VSNTLTKNAFAMPEPFLGSQQFRSELLEIKSTKVLEFAPLEQIPHPFLRIQLRSVARQSLQMNAFGSSLCQKILDHLTAMNGGPIPDDQQFARDLAQKSLQKTHDIWPFVRMILNMHEKPPIGSHTTNSREMIASQFHRQDRRLSNRGVGPHCHRQQVKSRLIYKNNGALFLFGLFFSSTDRCSRHRWIAASSRWVARWIGFWRLCLIVQRRRLQCVG